ncbi:hypothetical protein G6F31_018645 [Rhizopus arrhizus]|nr:hypothetical protein G6F31_018645 [Rhizopus arrhizus]
MTAPTIPIQAPPTHPKEDAHGHPDRPDRRRPAGNPGMAGSHAGRAGPRRPAAHALFAGSTDQPGPRGQRPLRGAGRHALRELHRCGRAGRVSRRPGGRTAPGRLPALECHGYGAARGQDLRRGRPHRDLCVGHDAVRNRLPPFLPGGHPGIPG